jgi:hypothetical protein
MPDWCRRIRREVLAAGSRPREGFRVAGKLRSDTISFSGYSDSGYDHVDDVVLTAVSPEPGTFPLFLGSLLLIASGSWRGGSRRSKAARSQVPSAARSLPPKSRTVRPRASPVCASWPAALRRSLCRVASSSRRAKCACRNRDRPRKSQRLSPPESRAG